MDAQIRRARFVADSVAEAIEGIEHGRSPLVCIARRLGEAVRADVASYGWFDTRSGDRRLFSWPVAIDWADIVDVHGMIQTSRSVPHPHPVIDYWLNGNNTGVAVVSALVTDRAAWRNSEAYALLMRGIGCTETGGVRLDANRAVLRAIGVARKTDFTRDELELLREMRMPAMALSAHADWLSQIHHWGPNAEGTLWRATNAGLTTREFEVLQLLATGLLASAIGARLSISTRTVHRHLAHIYKKLGTSDRLTTVMCAQAAGLLLEGEPKESLADDSGRSVAPVLKSFPAR